MSNPDAKYWESPLYLALSEGWDEYFNFVKDQGFIYEGSTCAGKQIHMASLILNTHAQLVYEIGFNAGHMSFRMCRALQETGGSVIAFDLDENHRPAAAKMQELLPGTFLDCIWGDTQTTLPAQEGFADIIHVDGGHSNAVSLSDIREARRLIKPGGFIVIDDCQDTTDNQLPCEAWPWRAAKEILGEDNLTYYDHEFCYGDAFAVYRAK